MLSSKDPTAFGAVQIGEVRSGLTTEGGSVVVTDNYLKVRAPEGLPDNRCVRVRIPAWASR